jgi:Protein of unknown function (DUF3455)
LNREVILSHTYTTIQIENEELEVNNNSSKKFCGCRTAHSMYIGGGLLAAITLAVSGIASAQDQNGALTFSRVPNPATPADITPPPGNSAFLVGHAVGTQGYVCLPTGSGASWTVDAARPQATLFTYAFGDEFQIITHFLSPDTNPNEFAPNPLPFGSATWQSSFDSSKVWGQSLASVPAGSDTSCPNAGSIPCLLLRAIGSESGPSGGKLMTRTTYVQRLNTNGGSAPGSGCSVATDVGKQTLVPYSADYYFYRAEQ